MSVPTAGKRRRLTDLKENQLNAKKPAAAVGQRKENAICAETISPEQRCKPQIFSLA
jgi:hypothetical protein